MTLDTRPRLNATFDNLTTDQKQKLFLWKEQVDNETERQGLWVHGNRLSGTSYIANVAMRQMAYGNGWEWEWQPANDLIRAKRNQWNASEQTRLHPEDYSLYQEHMSIDEVFDIFWTKAHVVCIDDFHDDLDVRFWRKHLQPDLEQRVKARLPTIVATTMAPNHREFADIQRVIEHYFVTCHATR